MTALKRRLTRVGNRIGVAMYRTLNGRLSSGNRNVHVLLITTPGRRTGVPRSTCVRYLETGDGFLVWGTGSGSTQDPDWFRNLRKAEYADIQMHTKRFRARPNELVGPERDAIWRNLVLAEAPEVDKYARRAGRTIPVAVLEPCTELESPQIGELAYAVWIKAAPELVWRIYVDPHRIPDWQTGKPVIEDVHGGPGELGSAYVSRRGPLVSRTTVLGSDTPTRLVTRTEAYFGLELEVTSRLIERAGGTDLKMTVETHWRPRRRLVTKVVERAILSGREARKELAYLKTIIEREVGDSPVIDQR